MSSTNPTKSLPTMTQKTKDRATRTALKVYQPWHRNLYMTKFPSKDSLYFETGWEILANRRKNRKLTIFYKIYSKLCPPYLFNCLPPVTSDVNNYNLRNNQNYVSPQMHQMQTENISKLIYSIYRFVLEQSRDIYKKFPYIIFV